MRSYDFVQNFGTECCFAPTGKTIEEAVLVNSVRYLFNEQKTNFVADNRRKVIPLLAWCGHGEY